MCKTPIIAKVFKYEIKEVLPLSALEKYKDHHRMRVFYNKGVECSNPDCKVKGTQLAIGLDPGGNEHIDVYTKDFYPLNVDHIHPKSKGGSNELSNLQPMCYECNHVKSDSLEIENLYVKKEISEFIRLESPSEGDEVYRRIGCAKYKLLGVISKFAINPHTGKDSFMVEGRPSSYYHRSKKLYTKL